MLGSMSKKRNQDGKRGDPLNKTTSNLTTINRGVELLLRKGGRKQFQRLFK